MTKKNLDFIFGSLGMSGIVLVAATTLINATSSLSFLYFPAWISSRLAEKPSFDNILLSSMYLVLPLILSALLSLLGGMLGAHINNNIRSKAKAALYDFILKRPPMQRYEQNLSSGAIDNLMETASYSAREVCQEVYTNCARVLATLGVVVYVVASVNNFFVLPLLLIIGLVIAGSYFHQKINNLNVASAVQSKAQVSRHIIDTARNISLIEVSESHDFEEVRLDKLLVQERKLFYKALIFQEYFFSVHRLIAALLIGYFGAYLYLGPNSSGLAIGQLMPTIFILLFSAVQIELAGRSISNLGELSNKLSFALGELGFQRATKEALPFEPKAEMQQSSGSSTIVKLQSLSFAYNKDTTVLRHVDFEIKRGEKIALVGSSGSGKSTLVKIIAGLLPPSSGLCIKIPHHDHDRSIKLGTSIKVYYIHQDSPVLDRSLKENVCYGASSPLCGEEVFEVLRSFGLSHLLERNSGIDTQLGEMGLSLSGGERQRLSLARAYIAGADILIFDEATSALDIDSETILNEVLQKNFSNTTTITIAHRLSSLSQANRLIVLEGGVIATDMPWSQTSEPPSSMKKIYSLA